jgi:integrase
MLKEYPEFKRREIEEFYKTISKKEKGMLDDYLIYRKARGLISEEKIKDTRRYVLHIRCILQKELKEMELKDLRNLLAIINNSRLSDYVKNTIKTDLKNFLKYLFPDWSLRFSNLEDIKLISNPRNEKKINSQTLFQKEDIEKLMKHETKMLWKAFLITQYEGGLRTKETRFLKWEDITFNVDGDISEITIYATKTKKTRPVFVKEATYYLNKVKEEQEHLKQKSIFVFHSVKDINIPIDKHNVSIWFRSLTKKALGREGWNYLLRHSRATELYRLAKHNKIAKDTAVGFMGHSEDMSKVYEHFDEKEIKEMLKNQVYKLEDLPEEKKTELEKEINELKKVSSTQQDEIVKLISEVKELWGAAGKIRNVKLLLEAADQNDIIKGEFKKYIDGLSSKKET